jgi:hypothetical protein
LYSDDDEVLFRASRPIILNGIETVATRGDLADRAIVFVLPPIPDQERRTERALWGAVDTVAPGVLGAVLDVLAKGLRALPDTTLAHAPRMADFAQWIAACAPAVGWQADRMLAAYAANRAGATAVVLESSAVAEAVLSLMADVRSFVGTGGALLEKLTMHVPETVTRDRMRWPGSARKLASELRRLAPALRAVGVNVTFPAPTDRPRNLLLTTVGTVGPSGQCDVSDGLSDGLARLSDRSSAKNTSNGAGSDDPDSSDDLLPISDALLDEPLQ